MGTTSSVLIANPEAIIVFVENFGDPASETFAMTHPAIDMISTSYGLPASLPLPGHITNSFTGVFGMGKLHFGASDNSPATALGDTTAGPWWSIGIAGLEEGTGNGRQVQSGNQIDFLGDFTQDLPYCVDCERGTIDVGGTSFATPRSAGTASRVLLEARRATGHGGGIRLTPGAPPAMVSANGKTITNWQLRRALEVAAWIPSLDDYEPSGDYPIPPGAPWAVAGWGVLTTDPARGVVQETLAQLGIGGTPTRSKELGFCAHQTALIQARKGYWDWVNVDSETFMSPPNPDPFLFCELP